MDAKPLTGDEASEFAKRELRTEIARKSAADISQAALATAKYRRRLRPRHVDPGPRGVAPAAAPGGEAPAGAAQDTEKPAGETEKDQPKN